MSEILNDAYASLKKNTVDSREQLKESSFTQTQNTNAEGPRVLFLGNSMTLHGVCREIGWYGDWGMAASELERDYVHILEGKILEKNPSASFWICQVSDFERRYKEGREVFAQYESGRDFGADFIVIRFIENCCFENFDNAVFKKTLGDFIRYLDKDKKAKVIVTTGFWRHPGDGALMEYARENDYPCIELGDLGERDDMKAIGRFEHGGVAAHPGDLGMKYMAERIANVLLDLIPLE